MKIPALFVLLASTAVAQPGQPALPVLKRIQEKFGPQFLERIFEMKGVGGDPQPAEWRVTAHDPVQRSMLHEFWVGGRRVTDEGLNDDFYPERLPKGFFKLSRLELDSTEAFAIAEELAREARVGFDLVNYNLHCREYSDEPVWTLTLLDSEEEIVGSVHLSGESGNVLRTVWIRRGPDGRPVVQDTALGFKRRTLAAVAPEARQPDPASDSPEPRRSEFGVADEEPPPPPLEPEPSARPSTTPPAPSQTSPPETGSEIPEIRKLNEVQEKAFEPKPPQ